MTEKDYNPQQKVRKAMEKQKKVSTPKLQETSKKPAQEASKNKPIESNQKDESLATDKKTPKATSEANKPKEDKKIKKQIPKIKKSEVVVNGMSIPVSTKYSIAICKFIKNKKIERAIYDLGQVIISKKAVPMKGEIPHRKGKDIMSGRYPKRAAEQFIRLLKSLLGNANNHNVEEPIITEAVANIASRPYGRFGSIKRKRTHIKIVAKERNSINKKNKLGKGKK